MCFPVVRLGRCLALSLALFAAVSFARAYPASPNTGDNGLQASVSPLSPLRSALESTLAKLPAISIPEATATLLESYHALLDHPDANTEDRFAYFALVRALKAQDTLKSAGIDLQLSLLWSGVETALQEIGASHADETGRAAFGVNYSLFLSAIAESTINASAQYELMGFALEFLNVDLASDPHGSAFVEAGASLSAYLDSQQKSPPKSDRDRLIALRQAREAYQSALSALKSTELASVVVGTENPTLEYNRRVLRRNLDNSDAEIQIASMEKLMTLSANEDDQRRILSKLGDASLSTCSAAYYALKNQSQFPNSLVEQDVAIIKSDSVPRTCRYAAALLSLKFDQTQMKNELGAISLDLRMQIMGIAFLIKNPIPKIPMELGFTISKILSGDVGGLNPDLNSFCNSAVCVGDFALVHGFFKNHYALVSRVDNEDRIQVADSDHWIKRKKYSKSVASLDGVSVGDLVVNKKASWQKQTDARLMMANHAGTGGDFQTDWLLEKVRGRVQVIFENGFVLLTDTDIDAQLWTAKAENLVRLQ